MALAFIRDNAPGAVIYLQQEGRGIGLANKIAAYSLQEEGYDTVDANRALGLPDDSREYSSVLNILKDLQIKSVQLIVRLSLCIAAVSCLLVQSHDERFGVLSSCCMGWHPSDCRLFAAPAALPISSNSPQHARPLSHQMRLEVIDDGLCRPTTRARSTSSRSWASRWQAAYRALSSPASSALAICKPRAAAWPTWT